MKASALIESIAVPELRLLHAIDPVSAALKARRMVREPVDFMRGCLPLIVPWLVDEIGPNGPWCWSVGDAHHGNFATLAVGAMKSDGVVPVTFGVADVDDEAPAPWSWDLLRLLSSVALTVLDMPSAMYEDLCEVTLASYRECLQRLGEGDLLANRIDANGLPEAVKSLIVAGSGEARHKRFIADVVVGKGASARLRRATELVDEPESASALLAAWDRRLALPKHQVVDLARRLKPGGLSSLGRRRWWLLVRELEPVTRLRLLEIKERAPSVLSRAMPVSPFAPWGAAQPVVSTMGNDPYQRVLHLAAGSYLVRTRCHTRDALDLTTLDPSDWRRFGHLHGQLLATFHWRGLSQLLPNAPARCQAIAADTVAWNGKLAKRARRLATHLEDLSAAFRKRIKPLLSIAKDGSDVLELH